MTLANWAGRGLRDSHWVARWAGRTPTAPSGWKGNGSQSGQGAIELGFPGPALGKMQGEAARRLLVGMGRGNAPIPPSDLDRLTARERQILKMFAEGRSYAEIGEARGNNLLSVRNAVYAIQRKLGVGSRQEMGVWAARSGLLDDELL